MRPAAYRVALAPSLRCPSSLRELVSGTEPFRGMNQDDRGANLTQNDELNMMTRELRKTEMIEDPYRCIEHECLQSHSRRGWVLLTHYPSLGFQNNNFYFRSSITQAFLWLTFKLHVSHLPSSYFVYFLYPF